MHKTVSVFMVLLNLCSAMPSEAAFGNARHCPAANQTVFTSQAIPNPDVIPYSVPAQQRVLKAQLLARGATYAMRKPEPVKRVHLLGTWLPKDDQEILIQEVRLLAVEHDYKQTHHALLKFGVRGENGIVNRNRFRALVVVLSVTLLHPNPMVKGRAEALLSDLIRAHGVWEVEVATDETPALTADDFIAKYVTIATAYRWSANCRDLIYLYRDLWPKDLNVLAEANNALDPLERLRATQIKAEQGRGVVERLLVVAADEGRLDALVRWYKMFPDNLPIAERGFYLSEALKPYRVALQASVKRALEASREVSDRQSDEINQLQSLITRYRINQNHISLKQLTEIVRLHGPSRAKRFAAVIKNWKPKDAVIFLRALAKTESIEIHQTELETLADQLGETATVLQSALYPWGQLTLASQVRLTMAQGVEKLEVLGKLEPTWTPPHLLSLLKGLTTLEPADQPYEDSIRKLSRAAKDVQRVLTEFGYPWSYRTLADQISLATVEPNMRIGFAKRMASDWQPNSKVLNELSKLDEVERTSGRRADRSENGADSAAAKAHTAILRKGSRVYWEPGIAGATIDLIEVAGGENPDIRFYIRVPDMQHRDRASVVMSSLGRLQETKVVPVEQMRLSALAALRAQNIDEVPKALGEKYPFLLEKKFRRARSPEAPVDTETKAKRGKIDPQRKEAEALWKRLSHWGAHQANDWIVVTDPAIEGELWKGGTIGLIYKPLEVSGEEDVQISPTVTYAADGQGHFRRYDFVPAKVGRFAWPLRAAKVMEDLDKALGIKDVIKARELSSQNHLDPHFAIAAGQVVKMTEALGSNQEAARQAFHQAHQEIQVLMGQAVRGELAATLKKLKHFAGPEIEQMQKAIRAPRKGQWALTHALWNALSQRPWGQRLLSRFEDEDHFTAEFEEVWVPWTLVGLVGVALSIFGSSPSDIVALLPAVLVLYRVPFVLMHLVGDKDARPQDLPHWNRIFLIAAAPLVPLAALHSLPTPVVWIGSVIVSLLSKKFHRQNNSSESQQLLDTAA